MLLETNFNHNQTKWRLIGKILNSNDLGYLAMRSDLSNLMRQVKPLKVSLIVEGYNSTWSLSLWLEINIYISLMCTHQLQVSLKAK